MSEETNEAASQVFYEPMRGESFGSVHHRCAWTKWEEVGESVHKGDTGKAFMVTHTQKRKCAECGRVEFNSHTYMAPEKPKV